MARAEARTITPLAPVPLPEYLAAIDWKPNIEELSAPTPADYHMAMTNSQGKVQYYYVPVEFVIWRLNTVFASPYGPQWGLEQIDGEWGEWVSGKTGEGKAYEARDYTGTWQLVWPGQFRPLSARGTSTFRTIGGDSAAGTINAAQTLAFKSCGKQVGIGRDVEKDDPDTQKKITSRQNTIQMVFDQLVKRDAATKAAEAVASVAPGAVGRDNSLHVDQIAFGDLERVETALSKVSTAVARAAREGAKPLAKG